VGNELLIEIKGSAKEFLEALESVKNKTGDFENQVKFSAGVAGAAWAAFSAEIFFATEAYAKQEIATNRLSASLQAQGIYSASLVEEYRSQADAIEKKTGVDAEAIVSGQGMLQSMIGQTKISKELTQGIVDLAARTGKDLSEAFTMVGKSVEGHSKGLKQLGLVVDDTADTQTRLKQITEGLSQQFAGAAASANQGLGGIKGLHVSFENLQKHLGEKFAPAIEVVIQGFTRFFNTISDNKVLVELISTIVIAGSVAAGLAVSVALGAGAWIKYREAMAAAKIATETMSIATKGLISATGIGLLLVIVGEIYLNWNSIWPRMQGVFAAFVNNVSQLAIGYGTLLLGVFTLDKSKIESGWNDIKEAFRKSTSEYSTIVEESHRKIEKQTEEHEQKQNQITKAAADKRETERRFIDAVKIDEQKVTSDLLILEAEQGSAESIKLAKEEIAILKKLQDEKNTSIRDQLKESLDRNRELQAEQDQLDIDQQTAFDNELLKHDKEYQALSEEQKTLFLEKNRAALQSQIDNERTTSEKAAKAHLELEIKANNQYLENKRKFGSAVADVEKFLHSKQMDEGVQHFSKMSAMQQSQNDTLKAVGKAAAIANVTIETARSAMSIFMWFSEIIPIVGPALGAAAAAAAVAFGAEQIGQITSAAHGGLITGGMAGRDSVPALLMPGELVVPTKNYEEVITSVSQSRQVNDQAARTGGSAQQASGELYAQVELSFKNGAMDFIESKIIERRRMGISLLPKV
jgi:hypothetical protein